MNNDENDLITSCLEIEDNEENDTDVLDTLMEKALILVNDMQ